MDDGPAFMTAVKRYILHGHQLFVADSHSAAVHIRDNAVTADLLDICYDISVDFPAPGFFQAPADRMGGSGFRMGRQAQEFLPLLVSV